MITVWEQVIEIDEFRKILGMKLNIFLMRNNGLMFNAYPFPA